MRTKKLQICTLVITLVAVHIQSTNLLAEPAINASQNSSYPELQQRLSALTSEFYALEKAVATYGSQHAASTQGTELQKQLNALYFELAAVQDQMSEQDGNVINETQVAGRGESVYLPDSPPPPALNGESSQPGSSMNLQSSIAETGGLKISGFMDAVYEANASTANNDAHLNQVEIDFTRDFSSRASAFLGIWYASGFQVGYANMTYKLLTANEGSTSAFKSWSVQGGQFDPPFGEDVASYSSNIRKTISIPEIVKNTHGMWNDIGVQTNVSLSIVSADLYTVRGLKLQSYSSGEESEYSPDFSAGCRLNCKPMSSVKLGSSFAHGWLPSGQAAMNMYGAHATFTPQNWSFIVEGLALQEDVTGDSYTTKGYYLQAQRQLGRAFVVSRADYSDIDGYNPTRFYSAGAGVNLGSGLEARSEYKFDGNGDDHQGLLQIVATF